MTNPYKDMPPIPDFLLRKPNKSRFKDPQGIKL